jgi:hypothetical protein
LVRKWAWAKGIGFLALSSSGGSRLGGRFVAAYQNAMM